MARKRLLRSVLKKLAMRMGVLPAPASRSQGDQACADLRTRWLTRLGREAPVRTIFDVGAYDGSSVAWLHNAFPEATIYSFEPFGPSYDKLCARVAGNKSVVPIRMALGDVDGAATYHANSNALTGSLLPNAPTIELYAPTNMVRPKEVLVVEEARMDGFCSARQIDRIDVLKIDTQGFEARVLSGAGRMLNPTSIRGVMLEMNFVDLYEGQASADRLMTMLHSSGYRLFGFCGINCSNENGWHWADALFVKASGGD